MYGFMKKSIEDKAKQDKLKQLNSVVFKENERTKIWGALKGMKGFERDLEKEDLLRTASVLRGDLRELGFANEDNVVNAAKLAALLRSTGLASDNESAVNTVSQLFKGNATEAFDKLKPIDDFGKKYLETMKDKWELSTKEGGNLKLRPEKVLELIKDISSLKITGHSSDVNKAKSDLAKIEQTLENVTNNVLTPIISKISTFIDKVSNFNFSDLLKEIGDAIKNGISGAFDGVKNVGSSVVNYVSTGFSYINPLGNNFLGGFLNFRGGGDKGSDDLGQFK
ncbi:conserved hypothetical protein (plasmid) [Borreliella spielmanii A14S]|uniref:Uncharacterized protein n=1 Tax=Borreliella spielmanii A14S TaxID=498742 RepID=B9X956_9SPIR|nr:conserved hypothetical protein [Borreliella spielmanii A14S]